MISNSINQNLILDDNQLLYKDSFGNKLKVDKTGYNFGNINFKNYISEILDFLNNKIMLNTPCGPSSAGCSSTASALYLKKINDELQNINK